MLTWFSPCTWGASDGYESTRNFYHGTMVGRAMTNAFWSVLGNDVLALNKYDSHPEMAKLKPWSHPMFVGSSFSILNYDTDFFELLRNGTVRIHIADITKLSKNTVHLSNGSEIPADALCCVTGWKHTTPFKFLPEGIELQLGIPHAPVESSESFPPAELIEKADKEILERFPRLKDPPVQNKNYVPLLQNGGVSTTDSINPSTKLTPYTLHRFMVPPSQSLIAKRDVVFVGMLMNFTVSTIAHVQSIWIDAYFKNELHNMKGAESSAQAIQKVQYEAVLHSRNCKWRYTAGHGHQFPDFVFDAVPYIDQLVGDLGLPIYRKDGWVAEASQPYGPEDYKDLVAEWVEQKKED
jgi:hypothetical protein